MVDVIVRDASGGIVRGALPAPEFLDYQEQSQAFEDVVGTLRDSMHWVSDAGAESLTVAWVTPNAFTFLGVRPLIGRVFGAADAAPDSPAVAVLNHRTWNSMFGGDAGVVGRTIVLNRGPRTIIGVKPMRVLNAVRPEIRAIDRRVALVGSTTMESALQRRFYAQPQFSLIVLGMVSCTGLVLVALGVYGVLGYTVSQQSREIAIRMALGGERRHVLRMVFGMACSWLARASSSVSPPA